LSPTGIFGFFCSLKSLFLQELRVEVGRYATVLQNHPFTYPDESGDVVELDPAPHQLHHSLVMIDVPTN
jgi:hypothetical protein